jgi:hypothetical protein
MTYRTDTSLSDALRIAEQIEQDELVRFKLRTTADELDAALRLLTTSATGDNLARLNGLWANAIRTLGSAGAQHHVSSEPVEIA